MTAIPHISAAVLDAARPTCQASDQLNVDCHARAAYILRMHCPCGIDIALVCTAHREHLEQNDITCPVCGFEVTPIGRERL